MFYNVYAWLDICSRQRWIVVSIFRLYRAVVKSPYFDGRRFCGHRIGFSRLIVRYFFTYISIIYIHMIMYWVFRTNFILIYKINLVFNDKYLKHVSIKVFNENKSVMVHLGSLGSTSKNLHPSPTTKYAVFFSKNNKMVRMFWNIRICKNIFAMI